MGTPVATTTKVTTNMSSGPVLENKKWKIENVDGNSELKVEIGEIGQSVYMYNVKNSVVQISAKCTAVTLDKCESVGVVFEGAVALCDTVNSKKVQIQLQSGPCPQFNIDKSSSVKVFVNSDVREENAPTFVTAHSQEVLVIVLRGEDQDPLELAIPEQFQSVFSGDSLHTDPTDHL